MHASQLASAPLWLDQPHAHFHSLDDNLNCDVAIIGGGITGMTTAFLLASAGRQVALFEKGEIAEAETGHTTAHLTYVTDSRLSEIVQCFGEDAGKLVWQGGQLAIDLMEELTHDLEIDCLFQRVPGWLHQPIHSHHDEQACLRAEAEVAAKLGFAAEYVEHSPLSGYPAVRYDDQAFFNPVSYLSALAEAVEKAGGQIFTRSRLTGAEQDPLKLTVNGHAVRCNRFIVATHVPLTGSLGLLSATALQTKLSGYSTYVVGGIVDDPAIPAGSYNDTASPYHYLRISHRSDGKYDAILGGEDHKTGQAENAEQRYENLEMLLKELLPEIQIDHRWSGQVIETNDGLPYIGPATDQQFEATGFSGNGMTFGTLSAMMACDWVLGQENPWQNLFSLSRTNLRGGLWTYLKENIGYPYWLIRGYLKTPQERAIGAIPPDEGRILNLKGHRRAVYKAPDGTISNCSAICTHLGCVVEWNHAEKTWDCPCHGSRFSTEGHVVAGPAETPLEKDDSAHKQ